MDYESSREVDVSALYNKVPIYEGEGDVQYGSTQEAPKCYWKIDDAIEHAGIGLYQARMVTTGFLMAVDGMQMQMLSFLHEKVKKDFDVNDSAYSAAAAMIFLGMFIGSLCAGYLSDKLGRMRTSLLALVLALCGGLLSAGMPNIELLGLTFFLLGLGAGGSHPAAALFMEVLPVSRRLGGMIVWTSFWTGGILFECLIAYLLQHQTWRILCICSTAPIVAAICVYPLWDESPRFLALHGKLDKATVQLRKMCRINGRPLPNNVEFRAIEATAEIGGLKAFKALLANPLLRRITLVLWTVWSCSSLGYYGLILIVGDSKFGSGISEFGSTAIITAAEYPSYFLQLFLGSTAGRKKTFVGCSSSIAVLFLLLQILHEQKKWLVLIFFFLTRLMVTTMFDIAWMFTPEAYPTEIRSTGYGTCSSMARLSGIVAPFVAMPLYNASEWAAIALFAAYYVLTCLATLTLPFDTKDRHLDESVPSSVRPEESLRTVDLE